MRNLSALCSFAPSGVVLFLIGCAVPAISENPVTEESYEALYVEAEAARKKAAAVGSEWRDTKKLLDESQTMAAAGDYEEAIKLVEKAKSEGELAYVQAQKNEEFLKLLPFYNPKATPQEDVKNLQAFFRNKFSDLPDSEFANGFYAMDPVMRQNWEAIEEFPPYEPAIEEGEQLWATPFKNGKSYEDCFGRADIANNYPLWNEKAGEVQTLATAINACREQNGEEPLKYGKDEIVNLRAYIAYQSRGKPTNVVVPENSPRALEAYNKGKKFYFSRRGQLNLACVQCHFDTAGQKVRTNVLGPALGQTSHWPTYRSKWGSMGPLHRRYKGCNQQVRAKPFDFESEEYRNLEFFHTHMSNGIPLNGPGSRF